VLVEKLNHMLANGLDARLIAGKLASHLIIQIKPELVFGLRYKIRCFDDEPVQKLSDDRRAGWVWVGLGDKAEYARIGRAALRVMFRVSRNDGERRVA
jgi:hypothetical protein